MLQKGNTLIEVLVALAVGGIILSALTVLVTNGLNNAQFSKNQNLATKYSQDGMENIRRIRNQNYSAFATYTGTYCMDKTQTSLGVAGASCPTPNVDNFLRTVQIQQGSTCGAGNARVIVTTAWTDGKCQTGVYCHTSQLASCFSTVNPVSAP